MRQLPTIIIDGVKFYIDKKLNQIRNVTNPHDWEPVSAELIYYWLKYNIKQV